VIVTGVQDALPVLSVWADLGDTWAMEGQVSAYETLTFKIEWNGIGSWSMVMDYSDEAAMLERDRLVTIDWRGVRSTWGIVPHFSKDADTGQIQLEVSGVGAYARLGWDEAWPDPARAIGNQPVIASTDPAPYRGPAETVIKQLVRGNLRDRRGMVIAIPTDQGRGATRSARPVFDNLLEVVTNLAKLGGLSVDVGLINVGGATSTRANLTLMVDVPEDKTAEVLLTNPAGTIDAWEQVESEPTATKAIVGGAGNGGADRVFQVVTTPESEAAALAWGGHRVVLVDGPATFDPEELTQAGQQALLDGGATRTLSITAADSEGQMAFRDYSPGDKATGEVIEGETVQEVITSIEVQVSADDGVTVVPTFGDPSATDAELDIADQLGRAKRAIRKLERK